MTVGSCSFHNLIAQDPTFLDQILYAKSQGNTTCEGLKRAGVREDSDFCNAVMLKTVDKTTQVTVILFLSLA